MAMLKVTLSIGYSNAGQEDIIEVDDDELSECENDEEREELCEGYWKDWSDNYIDGGYELIEED